MKGLRFYQEFTDRRKRIPNGNVIAVSTEREHRCPDGSMEAIGAVFYYANSPVATTAASNDYLRKQCKRIPETKARTIHPRLFERLDREDQP